MSKKEFNEKVLLSVKEQKEIIADVSGFYYYWPKGNKGMFCSASLRVIADELDRINEPLDKEIEAYFNKELTND